MIYQVIHLFGCFIKKFDMVKFIVKRGRWWEVYLQYLALLHANSTLYYPMKILKLKEYARIKNMINLKLLWTNYFPGYNITIVKMYFISLFNHWIYLFKRIQFRTQPFATKIYTQCQVTYPVITYELSLFRLYSLCSNFLYCIVYRYLELLDFQTKPNRTLSVILKFKKKL